VPGWLLDLIQVATQTRTIPTPPTATSTSGTRYGLQALESELGRLALAPEGQRNATLVQAAFRAGQLLAGNELDVHHAHDSLYAVAVRIGLTPNETEATIRSGLTAGAQHPRRTA
jgi:hypothetical protein